MGIKKQDFYEGAALYQLVRSGAATSIRYDVPFFVLNETRAVYLKYSTNTRSPWAFTFGPDEQSTLQARSQELKIVIGLICGADGIAALPYQRFLSVGKCRDSAIRLSCYRQHNEHYAIRGPDGSVNGKIAPGNWQRLLSE